MHRRQLILALPAALVAPRATAHEADELHVYPGTLRPVAGQPAVAIALFEIHAGKTADALLAATSPAAKSIVIIGRDGKPAQRLPVRAGEDLALSPRGPHLRLSGIEGPLTPGREILLRLRFEQAGVLTGTVTVPKA